MPINATEIDRYIRQNQQRFMEELVEYIGIPSISINRKIDQHIIAAVDFIANKMNQSGLKTKVFETSGNPIVYGESEDRDAPITMLIYGHYDVFPVAERTGWNQSDPFKAKHEDDRIWGRGSADNKSQHLAHLNAISFLNEVSGSIPIKIKMIIEGEEETGSVALKDFITGNKELLRSDLCFYSDGPMYPDDHPVILLGVRGILCLELIAKTSDRPLHSGNFGGIAPNPAQILCQLISSMVDRKNKLIIPGVTFISDIKEQDDLKAIELLPFDLRQIEQDMGVMPVTGENKEEYYTRLLLRPNLNVAGIQSGYSGAGIKTIIPNQAVAKIDIRLVGNQDPDEIFNKIKEYIEKNKFDFVEIRKIIGQPPSKTDINHPYVETIRQAVRAGFGRPPLIVPSLAGTTPDYLFTKILGIPSFVVPYAPYNQNNHAQNESTKVSIFFNGIKTTAQLIQFLALNKYQS
jgi:acetylornithine deacetylase/succinyl-diaminopimelate desuccinylase-like protein